MNVEVCTDDRFELIEKAKAKLLEATNIEMRPDEMAVIDSILFRCWQMGWLDQLRESAALGGGECEWELEHSGTLYDKWRCSECKFLFVEPRCDQGYMDLVPNYCPNCGRKVKR